LKEIVWNGKGLEIRGVERNKSGIEKDLIEIVWNGKGLEIRGLERIKSGIEKDLIEIVWNGKGLERRSLEWTKSKRISLDRNKSRMEKIWKEEV
jgi:hypothetical protein